MARAKKGTSTQKTARKKVSGVTVRDVTTTLADVETRIRACRKWVEAQPEGADIKDLTRTLKEIELRVLADVEVRVRTVRKVISAQAASLGGRVDKALISAGNC